ncbi:MAG: hypothetical protein ACKVZ0_00135 [Gemmatimonadales bacterium]
MSDAVVYRVTRDVPDLKLSAGDDVVFDRNQPLADQWSHVRRIQGHLLAPHLVAGVLAPTIVEPAAPSLPGGCNSFVDGENAFGDYIGKPVRQARAILGLLSDQAYQHFDRDGADAFEGAHILLTEATAAIEAIDVDQFKAFDGFTGGKET